MILDPQLPPKKGYVEVEVNGRRTYRNTTTGILIDNEPFKIDEISELKNKLNETDYKIIKCSEFQLAGMEAPYDIQQLHSDRQAIRDKINELQGNPVEIVVEKE